MDILEVNNYVGLIIAFFGLRTIFISFLIIYNWLSFYLIFFFMHTTRWRQCATCFELIVKQNFVVLSLAFSSAYIHNIL